METDKRTLDLNKFIKILFETKELFFFALLIILSITLLYSLSLKNIYKAEALLVPTSGSSSSSPSANETASQLASLAGITIGQGNSASDKGTQALKILESRAFLINFLKNYDLIHIIYGERSWNSSKKILNVSNDYDQKKGSWIRNQPSDMQTYREFTRNHFKVVHNIESGFITISVEHYSPVHANLILENIIIGINDYMRERDLAYSDNAIEYLTAQLNLTNVSEVRNVFSNVIEDQIQTKMLANISDEYILRTIDPSRVPDRKFKPRRLAILAITFALTFFSFIFISLILFIQNKKLNYKIFPPRVNILSADLD